MLQRVAEHWKGAISAAIYVNETNYNSSVAEVGAWLEKEGRTNVAIHFMIQQGTLYPVNRLRNVAQNNTQAEYIFLIDVDFIPNKALEFYIDQHIERGFYDSEKQKALIVPALEMMKDDEPYPQTKADLLKLARQKTIQIFHRRLPKGHMPTLFGRWMSTSQPYSVFYKEGFEPYVVIKRELSPPYDERFLQRFYNKVAHVAELYTLGFEFWVMPEGYLVHMPHAYDSKKSNSIYQCAYTIWRRIQKSQVQRRIDRRKQHSMRRSAS